MTTYTWVSVECAIIEILTWSMTVSESIVDLANNCECDIVEQEPSYNAPFDSGISSASRAAFPSCSGGSNTQVG